MIAVAPAKVNLALHVVGRRPDGYHRLESPVAFTAFGDGVRVAAAERDAVALDGPPIEGPNIVAAARDALRAHAGVSAPVAIRVAKRIPVAAGLGGGSANAAACLRALRDHWRLALTDADLARLAAPLGADVPMCVLSRAAIARGVGNELTPVAGGADGMGIAALGVVLVNPGVPVPTPAVFAALAGRENPPLPPVSGDPLAWLAACRNDLEAPARAIAPVIGDVLGALRPHAVLARMSGSGATCFALTPDAASADALAERIAADHPDWFTVATRFVDGAAPAIEPE